MADWKPGDVAMLRCRDGVERVAILTDRGELSALWIAESVDWGRLDDVPVRPLVVIDPEDREQVERLTNALDQFITSGDDYADGVQAALREFANPTPDEPQGLGAVVEDADGDIWVHDRPRNPGYLGVEWLNTRTQAHWRYESIAAVRVLSPGYTEDGA